jgi:predicted transcriptional regulator
MDSMSQDTKVSDNRATMTLRMSKALHRRLALAAIDHERNRHAIITEALENFLDRLEIAQQIKGARHGKAASV